MKSDERKDKLFNIMNSLSELEYELDSFINMLRMLLCCYDLDNSKELYAITKVYLRFLESLHQSFTERIDEMDILFLQR